MRFVTWVLVVGAISALVGCGSTPAGDPGDGGADAADVNGSGIAAPSPPIDKIELAMQPFATNLDDTPGPDGVSVGVRLYNLDQPLAIELRRGTIEFLAFEGHVKDENLAVAEPFYIWRIKASDLAKYKDTKLAGVQYALILNWSKQPPLTRAVTIAARIPRPDRAPLYARPTLITVSN